MKISLFCIAILFVILLLPSIISQEATITLDKDILYQGDDISGTILVKNTGMSLINEVKYGVSNPSRDYNYEYFIEEINLGPGEEKAVEFSFPVFDVVPEGEYFIVAQLISTGEIIKEETKDFEIKGTKEIINAYIRACGDIDCNDIKTVFKKGDTVYLKIFTDVTNLQINSKLSEAGGSVKDINFNQYSASFEADKEGDYYISAVLNKEGYKELFIDHEFAVIEEPVVILRDSVCDSNGICSEEENSQNCPQDCIPAVKIIDVEEPKNEVADVDIEPRFDWIGFLVVFIVVVVIILIAYFKLKI